jgi:hypothetical protein
LKPKELRHYPTWDDEDSNLTFVVGINVGEIAKGNITEEVHLIRNSSDNRIRHITGSRFSNYNTSGMNEMDGKQ